MDTNVPRVVARPVVRRRCRLVRGLVWLTQVLGFLAQLVDELVTAWLGVAPVLPRWRCWRQQLVAEWRVYRAVVDGDVIEGEVAEGVWR